MPILTVKCDQIGKSRLQEFPSACCRTIEFVHFPLHGENGGKDGGWGVGRRVGYWMETLKILFFSTEKEKKMNIHKERKTTTQILIGFVLGKSQ